MDLATAELPDDVEVLRAMVRAQAKDTARLQAEVARLETLVSRWEHLAGQLRRMHMGRRSEKLDPEQFTLALEDLETPLAEVEAEQEKADPDLKAERTRERRKSRPSLPAHLPEVEVVIEPASTACPCCSGAMHRIGEDVSRRLDVVPAQYQVRVTRRPKYACRACEGSVVQAPAPARLIEGGLPTERLVAQVLTAKYADHTPLFRQAQALARQGVQVSRSVLAHWVGYAAAELKPVWAVMRDELLHCERLFVDETRAPVQDPGRGQVKTGYFWAIARDDRPWGGPDPPAVVYTYAPGRGAEHAVSLLGGFVGVLQTDGYGAYKSFTRNRNGVALAHCWSHVRRKFFDLAKAGSAPIAEEVLRRIGELYRVEASVRGQSPEARQAARAKSSRAVVEDLERWLKARQQDLPGRSPTAQAVRYALSLWDGLALFLDDGRLELDTNPVERAMRPIALGRKNSLFAGSDEGAQNWAVLATLVQCCKLRNVDPQAYFENVLTRLVNGHPQSRIAELIPWIWTPTPA